MKNNVENIQNQINFLKSKADNLYSEFVFTKLIKDENNPKKVLKTEKYWKNNTAKKEWERLNREIKRYNKLLK